MKKFLMFIGLMALMVVMSGCEDLVYKSYNTDNSIDNSVSDSTVTYSEEQEQILADGYIPDEEGVCASGFFWCSIESKCLPAVDGETCSLGNTDEEEAEATEISENG